MTSKATSIETVFVVDDNDAVRDALRWLLEAQGYHVQCYASAEQFLAAYSPTQIGCLILDVQMPGMTGLELQEWLIAHDVLLPTVFITGYGDIPTAVSTMKKGAIDFIEKPFNAAKLQALVERMLNQARTKHLAMQQQLAIAKRLSTLTGREHQVLEKIIAGGRNKQIADDLNISIKTVEAHRASIMKKLHASTVADLLRLVLAKS